MNVKFSLFIEKLSYSLLSRFFTIILYFKFKFFDLIAPLFMEDIFKKNKKNAEK